MSLPTRTGRSLSRASLMVAAALLGVSVSPQAKAATFNWNQTTASTYSWTTSANWNQSPYPNAIGDVANLSSSTVAQIVNLDAVITIGELNFGAQGTGSTNGYTLAAGTGGLLILDDTDGAVSINKLSGSPFLDIISADIQFNDALTISNNSGGGTLTLGTMRSLTSDVTLTGSGAVPAGSIVLGAISTAGGLIKDIGLGIAQMNVNTTYAGTTWIKGGRLIANSGASIPIRSAITIDAGAVLESKQNSMTWGSIAGAGNVTITSGTRNITIGRDDTSTSFSGTITSTTPGGLSVTKIGAGTLTLQPAGSNQNTYTGVTTVSGGNLVLDTSNSSRTSAFWATTPLTISGGNFELKGRSAQTLTQTLGAFVLGATGGSITLTPNSGTSTNLVLGAVNATASGGTLLITAPSTTTVTLGTAILSTALNGRAVFSDGTANTFNWATNATTATAVSGFLSSTALPSTGGGATGTSYILTAGQNQTTANATIGTLKLSSTSGTTQVLDLATFNMQLGGGTTSTPGAILIDGTANWNINGSTGLLTNNTPGTSPDLIFNHYGTGTVTVNAGIGGATALALVKAGPGTLVLAGTNAFTGAIFVNGGVLSFSNVAAAGAGSLGNGSATAVTIRDGATLRYTGSGAADTIPATGAGGHTFTLQGGLATIDVPITAATLILSGAIGGSATGGLIKAGAGTLRPSAASTYTGPTFVTAGTLQAGIVTAAFGSSSSPLDISAGATVDINSLDQTIGSLSGAGTVTNSTATAKTLTVGGANLTTTFTGSFTYSATAGNLFTKTGTGILILAGSTTSTWTGNHQVNGGVLRLATSNQFAASVPMYVANGAGPSMLELSSGVTQSVSRLDFGGSGGAATSQGTVLIGSGATLTLAGNLTYTSTNNPLAAYINGAGALSLSATRTITVGESTSVVASAAELSISAAINSVGAFGIVKTGFGNLLLSGANTFSGATTTLTAGGLILDYTTQNNAKIPSANSLTLNGGGSLILRGNASAGTSQDVLSTNLASGGFNAITLTPGGSQKIVFNMGAFTRAASAGTVRFTLPTGTQDATNGITTTTTNVNGVLGIGAAWATATDSAGVTNFAVNNGTNNIVLLTSTTNNDVTTWAAGSDVTDSTGYTGTTTVATNVNTLRFNSGSASTVTLGANLPLSVLTGGILQTANAANASISGGRLTSGTSSELIFTTDVAALPLTVSSTIAGNETITKTGLGTLKLTGVNAYTGGTLIQGGTLQVTGGNAIGDASVVTLTNVRTSVFELLGNETVAGIAGGNTGAGGLGEVRIGANTLRLNQSANLTYSGLLTGSGTIIKSGSGTMTIDATSGAGFTGTFEVSQGQVTLSGNVTQLAAVTSIVLSGPTAVLYLPNDQNTAVGSRINDSATVTLRNTAGNMGLSVRRTTGTSTGTETVGQLVLDAGHNTITADAASGSTPVGGWSFTNATSLVRNNLATALLVGKNLGFGSAARGRISFSVNPGGSVGGAGAAASTTISIFPYFVGESTLGTPTTSNVGNSFVTYVSAAEGMRPLDVTTEYLVDSAAPASGTNNVRYTSTTAITTPAAINSLVLDSATGVALTGSASSMQITSGAILATGAGSSSISTLTGLTSGATPVPYYVYVTNSSGVLTLNTPLTSAAPLVKSGAGNLVLSSTSNAFTDVHFNQGALQVANVSMLGAGSLKFFGGTLQLGAASGGFTGDPSAKTITFGTGGGTLDTNGNSVTFTNGIGNSGAGGLTKIGTGTLTLNGAASYTGATTVSAGTLAMGVNSAIGTGALTVSSAATLAMGANNATVSGLTLSAGSANIISGTGTLTVNGDATLNQGTVSAALAGSMNLLKSTASQTVTLSNAANTFTGYTWIQDGTLSVTALANAGSSSSLGAATGANASILIGNGAGTSATLAYSSASNSSTNRQVLLAGSTGGATIDSGSLAGLLTMSGEAYGIFAGAKALTLQGGNGDTSTPNVYSGLISNGVGVISVTKSGAGTWRLSGSNTYSGPTTVTNGTLILGNATAMGSGAATITGGTLNLNSLTIANAVTVSGGTLSGGTIALSQVTTESGTISAILTGASNLTKLAAGTLILSAANDYTGTTTVFNGDLQVGASGTTGDLGAGAVTLSGGTLTINRSNAYALSNSLSGRGSFRQIGSGTTTLSGTNSSYTGTTTISAGTLTLGNATAMGSGAATITGGTLNLNSQTIANAVTVSGGTLSGGTIALSQVTTSSGTISAILTGAFNLTKSAAGTLTLSGTNDYSGTTTVSNGTLTLGNATAMGSGAATISGGTLNLNSQTITNAVTVSGGTLSGGTIALSQVTTSSGTISAILTGAFNLTKSAAGTLTLSGANDYSGTTTVSNGTLTLGNATALGSGAATISGGTLNLNSQTITNAVTVSGGTLSGGTIALSQVTTESGTISAILTGASNLTKSAAGTLTLSGANDYSGTTTVSNGTLQVGAGGTTGSLGSGSVTLSGGALTINRSNAYALSNSLSGSGAFSQIGSGTTTLSGTNTSFTGTTTISAGTLTLGNATAMGSGAATITGGTLNLNSQTITNAVTVSGGTLSGGTIALSQVTASSGTISAILTGDSNLTKSAAGTLTLSGANDYTGTTTISNGTLTLGNATALGSGAATISGGTLNLNSQTITNAVTVSGGTLSGGTIALSQVAASSGTISAILTGATALTKSSTGTLTLSGANTYSLGTTISGGTLQVGAGGTTGSLGSGAVTLSGGALTINLSNAYALSNSLSGSGAFSQIGSGTTTLSGTNTSFTGTTTISAGTLTLGNATAMGSGAATITGGTLNLNSQTIANAVTVSGGTLSGGTIALSQVAASSGTISAILTGASNLTKSASGTLTLSGANDYTGATTISNGTLQIGAGSTTGSLGSGAVTLSGGTLTINRSNAYALSNSLSGSGAFSQIGSGTTTLSGTNTSFTGTTTVSNGTLTLGNATALGSGAATISGGTLNLNSQTIANTITVSGGTLSGGTIALSQVTASSGTISAILTGATALTKSSTGTLTLSGANTYSLGTTLSGGTLQVGAGGTTGSLGSGAVTLSGGALTINRSNDFALSNGITGTGSFTQSGFGTTTLSGTNTFTGAVTVANGTLVVASNAALGDLSNAVTVAGNANVVGTAGGTLVLAPGAQSSLTSARTFNISGRSYSQRTGSIVGIGESITLSGTVSTLTSTADAALVQIGGLMTLSGTVVTGTSTSNLLYTGSSNMRGAGSYAMTGTITGAGVVYRANGQGTMIFNPTDASGFSGVIRSNAGTYRFLDPAKLGTNVATGTGAALYISASSTMEFRSGTTMGETVSWGKALYLGNNTTGTLVADHAPGSSAINQINAFSSVYSAGTSAQNLTLTGRNGAGFTFTGFTTSQQAANGTDVTVTSTLGAGTSTIAGDVLGWDNTNTVARIFTAGVAGGDLILTGSILAAEATNAVKHTLVKTGLGTLTIQGVTSTITGDVTLSSGGDASATTGTSGTTYITDFRSLGTTSSGVIKLGNAGTTTGSLTIGVVGTTPTVAGLTTSRVISINTTTKPVTINASQPGANPVVISSNFTGVSSATARTLFLGGSNTADNLLSGVLPDITGVISLTKNDAGTWALSGANTYTGATTITGGTLKLKATAGASNIIASTAAVTFDNNALNYAAGGTLELVALLNTATTESLGALTPTAGMGTVKLTGNGFGGTANLIFSSLAAVNKAAAINFDTSSTPAGSVTFTTAAASSATALFGDGHVYVNGTNFAYSSGTSNVVIAAPIYGVTSGFVNAAAGAASLTSLSHNFVTGAISAQTDLTISSLKLTTNNLTLASGQTLTIQLGANGEAPILQSGGTATITGGAGITSGGSGALVFRVNGATDILNLDTPMLVSSTGGFTKSGLGTLVLNAVNAETTGGAINILEGTVKMAAGSRIGATGGLNLIVRTGAILDLNGTSQTVAGVDGSGTITNTSATAATLIGGAGATWSGSFSEAVGAGKLNVTRTAAGNFTLNGLSTNTGVMTFNITTAKAVSVTTLADIGTASSIGKGDATDTASNAASLVFGGDNTSGLTYVGQASVSTNRLFTLNSAIATPGAAIANNSNYNAALVFSNTGAIVFGAAANAYATAQTLTLTGSPTSGTSADNYFGPKLTNNSANTSGTTAAQYTALTKSGTSIWVLGNTANDYSGTTTISGGVLNTYVSAGSTLSASSPLFINGGQLQTQGEFTRSLAASAVAGSPTVTLGVTASGFSAGYEKLTVAIGGTSAPTALTWGSGGFFAAGSTVGILLNSATSLAEVEIKNAINLNQGSTNNVTRTITVTDNAGTGTDFATITGLISNSTGAPTNGTALSISGGILRLFGANTYAGATNVTAGTLTVNTLGNSGSPGVGTSVGTSTSANTTTGALRLGNATTGGAILQYVGAGEESNRLIQLNSTTGGSEIHADGSGPLVLTNVLNNLVGGAKTLSLRGSNTGANMVTSVLADNGGILSLQADGGATWILSGTNTFTGAVTVNSTLGIGNDAAFGTSALKFNGNGTLFAYGADRTVTNLIDSNVTSTAAGMAFAGDYSLNFTGAWTFTNTSQGSTLTNNVVSGKTVSFTGSSGTWNVITGNRTLTFNGSGDTVWSVPTSTSTAFGSNITYSGTGSLTIGAVQDAFKATGTVPSLTVSSGAVRIGANNVLPAGATYGNTVMSPAVSVAATLDLNGYAQDFNGFTATSAGTSILDAKSSSARTVTFGYNDATVSLGNPATGTPATGTFTFKNSLAGLLSLTKTGTGTMTLNYGASLEHAGVTTVSAGTLSLQGPLIFKNTPDFTVAGGATLNLFNSSGQTWNVSGLNLGAGSGTANLGMELGSASNSDKFIVGGAATLANTVNFQLRPIGGFAAGSYDLVTADSGLNAGTKTVTLSSITSEAGQGSSYALSSTATAVTLTVSDLTGNVYWKGGVSNNWFGYNASGSNFTSDSAGLNVIAGLPGTSNKVIFNAAGQTTASQTVSLDGPVFSGGLVFNNATGSGPLASITLNAAANAATTINGTLTLAPSASTDGIDIQTGAPATVTISTAISLGANQTWNVFDSGTTLTASGFVTGSYGLTKDGAGTLVLGSGSLYPTYTGPTVIKGGTLKAGATTMTSWFSSLEIQSGATFTTNGGADLNIAALSGAGTVNNTHASTGVVLYAGYNNADTTFSGTIVNGAAGTQGLRKVGSGVLTLNAASAASTATGTLAAYAGSILFDYSASSLTSMWTGTGAVFLYGGGLVWKANPFVAMNASLGALTSSAGANSLTIDPNGSTLLQVVTLSGSVTDSASGMSLLVTSPANTEIRLGSNYTATSGSAPRGKIVFTTGDGNFDFIKNAGATTASAAFTDYTLNPTPSAGATDTNTPKLTSSLALAGSWTTDKMKIQTSAAGQTLNIGAGNTLTLTAGGLIFQGDDAYTITGGSIQGYTSVNSDLVAHVYGNGVLTLASNVTNGIGASVFTKAGPGTLNLTGQILSTGASYINQGVLNINAAQSITGNLTVLGGTLNVNAAVVGNPASTKLDMAASGSGGRTVVNVAADMTLFATTQGGERGSANAYNQTAGTVTVTPGNTGTQYVAAAYGYGYFNLTGGTYNISGSGNRFMATGGTSGLGVSVIKVGGTGFLDHTNAEWFLNYGNTSITVSDTGLIDHTGSTSPFALIMNSTARDMIGSLNVAGGTVKTGNQPIQVGYSATAGSSPGAQAFINLAKGTLSTGANLATTMPTANDAFIYFAGAGGTLKASNNLTNFLPATIQGATLNAVLYGAIDNKVGSPDFDGGLTVDTSGFDVAFSASLRAAAGVGITQADMTLTAGSGYVGAPLVRFSTTGMIPGGTPAQGYAIIDAALGTVTGIVITNPGTYVAGTVPKLDLIGGGGSGASVAFSGLSTANAAAGLTKVGNGKLTLNAANTYAGGTNVNAGTLALGGNEVLADTGAVTVGGGTLDLTSFVETAGIVTLDSGTITGTTGSLSSSSDFRLRSGTVSGILTGAGGIAKTTSGTVALSAGNTFSGTVSVAAGKLQFSADANLGNGSATNVVSVNGGTLAYTAASALTLSANRTIEFGPSHATIEVADAAGVLTLPGVRASSTGNLTKTGVGKLVLAGTTAWNSGANGVTVNAGTLQAGFGTGGVAAINVGAAGTLNFINSTAEVLTLGGTAGALTLAGGANLGFELGASGSNDKIVVGAGGTAVTAGNVTINLLTIAGFGSGTFDLLSAPSGLKPLGVVYSLGSAPSGYNYTINQTDTLVSLVVAAFVPRYWTNAQTGGSWATLTGGTASNWSTDTAGLNDYGATPGSADTVIFSATSLAGGALTTTLDGSYTIDGLQFINATSTATTTFLLSQGTGSGTLTIAPSSTSSGIVVAANAGAVTISAPINATTTGGAASQTWSIDGTGASSLTVTGNITIGAGINKTGAGTLTLSGTNTGSGGVTIGAGALHVGSANALGTGALTVGALTTFDNSSGSALTLANNTTNWNGAYTFTGTNDLSFGTGGATLGQSLTATIAGRVLTVASVTDGAGSYDLTKAGAGTLTITGALTIGGAMSLNAGTLNIGTGGNMGAVTAASGTTLAMSGANTLASLIGTSATLTLSGANTISGVVTLNGGTLTASGNNPSIGGAVTINSGTATFSGNNGFASASLVTGSLTLSGTNTFVTGLSMAAGTLNLNSAGALGAGSLAISGGTLNNSSGSAKVLTGTGAGSVTGSFIFTGSSSLSIGTSSLAISGNPTFTISGSTLTFGGDVTGASMLTKTGTGGLSVTGGLTHDGGVTVLNGTLTVGASSSYTGATSIQASAAGAGTLVLSGTSTLTNAGNSLTMGSLSGTGGARLDLSNGSASFNSLTVQTNHATANTIVIGTGQELNIGGGVTIGVNGAGATTTRLTISGAGTFSIGTPEDPTGAGFQLGAHTTSAFSNDATLTMSGLTAFYANLGAGTFKVGDPTNSGGAATAGSKLYLAKTSTIIASTITSDTQNGSVTNYVYLGDTANVFNATNLYVSGAAVDGAARTNGQISWDSGVTTGTFRLRGLDGGDATAITNINVAYGLGTSAYATTGLVDLAGHSSDILATTINIGGNSGGSGTPGHKTGTFTFDTGSLVATTVNLGARTGGFQIANTITGTLNLMASGGSGTATFTNLTMGLNSSSSTTSNGASVATLNIGGGTVGITGTLTMGNNSIVGTTAQTVAPVQATTNISGGTVTIGTLNMNLNSAANSGTNRASVAGLYITGGTTEITALSLANTSTGTAIATSTLSITAGTLTLGADLAYTRTLGTVNSTLTLNGGTLNMSDKAIGVAGALIGTLNLQSGTLKNVNQINGGNGFTKSAGAGSNTLIIDGTNSFSGTFTISSGTVQVGAGSTTGTLGTVSVTNNAALTFNRSDAATFSNVITGSGTLTKVGNGTLTLTGNNSFAGGTTITNGTIMIGHASSLGGGTVNVGALGTLNLGGFAIGNSIVLATGATLTGGTLAANAAPTTGILEVVLTGGVSLTKADAGRLELTGANDYSGATSVSNGTIAVSGFGNGSTASPLGITDLTDPSKLVIGGGATLEFTGSDPVTTTARSFTIADTGTIAATGTGALNFNGNSKIKLTGATPALTLSATSTTAVNRFDSALDGEDAISTLTIDGVGIWVIGGSANRFKGAATFSIAAGATQGATLGFDKGSLGYSASSAINIGDNAVLRWSAGNDDDISGRLRIGTGDTAKLDIGGNDVVFASAPKNAAGAAITAGTIEKKGAGTLQVTFSSPNLEFNVPTGKLTVDGTVGNVNLTSSGTILGGGGTVGSVTTVAGSILSAGNSPGTLTIDGNLLLAASTILQWEVQDALDPAKYDQIHVTGNLDLTQVTNNNQRIIINVASLVGTGTGAGVDPGAPLNFNNPDTVGGGPRTFDFMRVDGAISFASGGLWNITNVFSFDLDDFQYTNGGSKDLSLWSISSEVRSGDTYIMITAVPEPSTYGFGLGALALAAAAIRRRRKNQAAKVEAPVS